MSVDGEQCAHYLELESSVVSLVGPPWLRSSSNAMLVGCDPTRRRALVVVTLPWDNPRFIAHVLIGGKGSGEGGSNPPKHQGTAAGSGEGGAQPKSESLVLNF